MENTGGTGAVKFFDLTKGFGFITQDNKDKDLFFHISEVEGPEEVKSKIKEGDRVEYGGVDTSGPKGPFAVKVKISPAE